MHNIEPYYKWWNHYVSSEDERSPFYGRVYNEFAYTQKIYNYFIHPQWDNFGSSTLYCKVLISNYEEGYACIELIGEWNDCITNDIMHLKRNLIDHLIREGISKFILLCDNVLNFHASDDSYYEEWYDDIKENEGWICLINTFDHVQKEMESVRLQYYINVSEDFSDIIWQAYQPQNLLELIQSKLQMSVKQLGY